jgi:hypothetical protein
LVGLLIPLKKGVQALQDSGSPVAHELGVKFVFAAKFRLAGGTGQ